MENEHPKCDVCGKPATSAARDQRRTSSPLTCYYEYSPSGSIKYGCNEHPAESVVVDAPMHTLEALDAITEAELESVRAAIEKRAEELDHELKLIASPEYRRVCEESRGLSLPTIKELLESGQAKPVDNPEFFKKEN